MQKTLITMQNYTVENGALKKGVKTITVFTASSRGTNCVLRDLANSGEAVVKYVSVQIKADYTQTKNAVQTLAGGLYKDENDKNAFIAYVMDVLTTANLFKVEKVNKA